MQKIRVILEMGNYFFPSLTTEQLGPDFSYDTRSSNNRLLLASSGEDVGLVGAEY